MILAEALIAIACAQAPAPKDAAPPPAAAKAPPASDPPSLDDALGIGGDGTDRSRTDRDAKVERSLSGAPPRDILESAIADMRRSKELLEASEAGLPARRAQESAVRKLDELIASAERMQQERNQQQGQQQQGQQQQGKQQKGKQGGDQQRPGEDTDGRQEDKDGSPRGDGRQGGEREGKADDGRRNRDASTSDSTEPPQNVDPTTADAQFDESRAEWGRLPPRVREAVRQGFRDPMSAAYRRLTQEYYRRLAEERAR